MQAMLAGFAAIIIIAIGANLVLDQIGFSSQDRYSGADVRLDTMK
ncbi:hypothetical protein Q4525_04940 [Shimia thalassica]|nr:hypothetical protein [Shimia thalassica]MDO6482637.1 hypothetical protein [Shimia thalassica]MDO6502260.1 hypothetical protein [Shimia thalassica]